MGDTPLPTYSLHMTYNLDGRHTSTYLLSSHDTQSCWKTHLYLPTLFTRHTILMGDTPLPTYSLHMTHNLVGRHTSTYLLSSHDTQSCWKTHLYLPTLFTRHTILLEDTPLPTYSLHTTHNLDGRHTSTYLLSSHDTQSCWKTHLYLPTLFTRHTILMGDTPLPAYSLHMTHNPVGRHTSTYLLSSHDTQSCWKTHLYLPTLFTRHTILMGDTPLPTYSLHTTYNLDGRHTSTYLLSSHDTQSCWKTHPKLQLLQSENNNKHKCYM